MFTIQAYGLCAFLILRICSWFRSRIIVLLLQIVSCFLFSYHYHLLGAFSGLIANLALVLLLIIGYLYKKKIISKNLMTFFICLVLIISAIISFVDVYSLLLIVALCVCCLGFINSDNIRYKICKIIFIVLWMIYGYIVGSYITFIAGIYIVFYTGLSLVGTFLNNNRRI